MAEERSAKTPSLTPKGELESSEFLQDRGEGAAGENALQLQQSNARHPTTRKDVVSNKQAQCETSVNCAVLQQVVAESKSN